MRPTCPLSIGALSAAGTAAAVAALEALRVPLS
jgi:hypothetical protein